MEAIIISLAILIFLAHLFSTLFVKTGVPEVLPLLLLGILIGPVLHLVSPDDFGLVDQVFSQVLLIVILFESGLGIRISQIRTTWAAASRLTIISFIITCAAVTLLAHIMLGLNIAYALILGIILADNSFAVIIPLISKLNISSNLRTTLLVECTMGSVITIVGAITMIGMAKTNSFSANMIIAKILYTFVTAVIIGGAAAVFWTTVLNKVRQLQNGIFLTLAFVFVVYSACQMLGSDGAIGSFIFGIVAGNIRVIRKFHGLKFIEFFTSNVKSKAFNEVEKSFFGEVVFVMRTFFFVYIGLAIQINSLYDMLCGFLFSLVIFLARIPVANYVLDKNFTRLDTAVASAMVPKGLVTAVLASLIAQAGLPGGQTIQNTIYSVIMFTIILSTVFAFLLEKGHARRAVNFLFKRHRDPQADAQAAAQIQSEVINRKVILK
ncbi:MAG: cation:proton antiporter [Elusimicrobiota bacterium]|jgi:NhaP-type Na+/H+ or K+/H+ antiporter|nr:cation:proton antiporter [Elusimicrobiota bacterium]